jgi:hypothetical protein
MEVICIETTAFYNLVDQVVAHVTRQLHTEQPFKWVSPERAMDMLHVTSKTTMQQFRDEGKIRFTQPARKIILYDTHSIDAFLEAHAREPFYRKR